MSGIEIGLIICVVIMCIFILMMKDEIKKTDTKLEKYDEDIRDCLVNSNGDLHRVNKELKKQLGYDASINTYSGRTSCHEPDKSVHQRINLLMDHLNLEIKEGEPSKTILVKKKPIKRGK